MYELRTFLSIQSGRSRQALLKLLVTAAFVAALEVGAVALVLPMLALISDPTNWQRFERLLPFSAPLQLTPQQALAALVIALFCVYSLKTVLQIYYYRRQTQLVARSQSNLANRLMRSYMLAPYSLFLQRHSAEVVRTITSLVQEIYGHFLNALLTMAADLSAAIALVILSLLVAPGPAIAAGALIITIHVVQHRVFRRVHMQLGAANAEIVRRELLILQQSLGAFREARVVGRESYFVEAFEKVQDELRKNVGTFEFVRRMPIAIGEMAIVTAVTAALAVFMLANHQFSDLMVSLGLLAAVAFRLSPIGNRLVVSAGTIHHARPALDIILSELRLFEGRAAPEAALRKRSFGSKIELVNVSYRYESREQPALSDITLAIPKGEMIGIVGASGAGKSTLVDILLGLLRPTEGTLLIDGEPAGENFHLNAGYVPQKVMLFDDTLLRNIAFGIPDDQIDVAAVERVVALAGLVELVRELPDGLRTALGEDGRLLSGGERQRVGIARALYGRPDLLVLDEPTSALDGQTETAVTESIASLRKDLSIVIITHRPAAVRYCDRIVVLNEGQMVDCGPLDRVQARNAVFGHVIQSAKTATNSEERPLAAAVGYDVGS